MRTSALKMAKKIGLRLVGSAMASVMSWVSAGSLKAPGEKAATYTEKAIHVKACGGEWCPSGDLW